MTFCPKNAVGDDPDSPRGDDADRSRCAFCRRSAGSGVYRRGFAVGLVVAVGSCGDPRSIGGALIELNPQAEPPCVFSLGDGRCS
jgi:hypothetical protein